MFENQIVSFLFTYVTGDFKERVVNFNETKFHGLARTRSDDKVNQTGAIFFFNLKQNIGVFGKMLIFK